MGKEEVGRYGGGDGNGKRRSLALIYAAVFVAECSRGVVIPTLFRYGQALGGEKLFLGLLVVLFSIGKVVAPPALGWLSTALRISERKLIVASLLVSAIANMFYGLALEIEYLISQDAARTVMLCSRFVLGLSTSIVGLSRSYVSSVTSHRKRMSHMAALNGAQFTGFSVTPLVGAMICYSERTYLNCFTSPGFLLTLVNLLIAVLIFYFCKEDKEGSDEESLEQNSCTNLEDDFDFGNAFFFLILNGVVQGSVGVIEMHGSQLVTESFMPDSVSSSTVLHYNGYYFGAVGTLGVIGYVAIWIIGSHFYRSGYDFWFILTGLNGLTMGVFLLLQNEFTLESTIYQGETVNESLVKFRFSIACMLIWTIGQPLCSSSIVSLFSKGLPDKHQGEMMGWLTSLGSVGRIVLPIVAGFISPPARFGLIGALGLASMASVLKLRKNMLDTESEKKQLSMLGLVEAFFSPFMLTLGVLLFLLIVVDSLKWQ